MNGKHIIPIMAKLTVLGLTPGFSFQRMQKVMTTGAAQIFFPLMTFSSVEGDSVTDAATGLAVALMNVYGAKDDALCVQDDSVDTDSSGLQ